MTFARHYITTLVFIFILDALWINVLGGEFYAEKLKDIGRFTEGGEFDVRLGAGIMVYLLMALGLEVFVSQNKTLFSLQDHLVYGATLGAVVYGVYDGTNRAILAAYPLEMVIVDMIWGTFLFTAIAGINFQLRHRLTF